MKNFILILFLLTFLSIKGVASCPTYSSKEVNFISSLPNELLITILGHLSLQELSNIAAVNKNFNDLVKDIWKRSSMGLSISEAPKGPLLQIFLPQLQISKYSKYKIRNYNLIPNILQKSKEILFQDELKLVQKSEKLYQLYEQLVNDPKNKLIDNLPKIKGEYQALANLFLECSIQDQVFFFSWLEIKRLINNHQNYFKIFLQAKTETLGQFNFEPIEEIKNQLKFKFSNEELQNCASIISKARSEAQFQLKDLIKNQFKIILTLLFQFQKKYEKSNKEKTDEESQISDLKLPVLYTYLTHQIAGLLIRYSPEILEIRENLATILSHNIKREKVTNVLKDLNNIPQYEGSLLQTIPLILILRSQDFESK